MDALGELARQASERFSRSLEHLLPPMAAASEADANARSSAAASLASQPFAAAEGYAACASLPSMATWNHDSEAFAAQPTEPPTRPQETSPSPPQPHAPAHQDAALYEDANYENDDVAQPSFNRPLKCQRDAIDVATRSAHDAQTAVLQSSLDKAEACALAARKQLEAHVCRGAQPDAEKWPAAAWSSTPWSGSSSSWSDSAGQWDDDADWSGWRGVDTGESSWHTPYYRARPGHPNGPRVGLRGSRNNPNVAWHTARARARKAGSDALRKFYKENPKPTREF